MIPNSPFSLRLGVLYWIIDVKGQALILTSARQRN